jgi:hypothetical protein
MGKTNFIFNAPINTCNESLMKTEINDANAKIPNLPVLTILKQA